MIRSRASLVPAPDDPVDTQSTRSPLTVGAGRAYHFRTRGLPKATVIYFATLAIGIGVVLVDELLR